MYNTNQGMEPCFIDVPKVWKGNFLVSHSFRQTINNKLSEIESDCEPDYYQNGESYSTSFIDDFRPHKSPLFNDFYKQIYNDLLILHYQIGKNQFNRPNKLVPVGDSGFVAPEYNETEDEFTEKHTQDPQKYNDLCSKETFILENSWLNVQKKGGFTSAHIHKEIQYVCAYYIDIPQGSGNVWFESKPTGEPYEVELIDGDYLIFPGDLPHGSFPSDVNDDRVLMTSIFNVKQKHNFSE